MDTVLVPKGEKENFSFSALTVHLHWDTTIDLDIFAIYQDQNGKRGLIYFAESGSRQSFPFIELLFDFEFSEIPVDHQEIIAVSKLAVETLWIFAWDFDAVQEGYSIDFQAQKVFVELKLKERALLSSSADLGVGNVALLGVLSSVSSETNEQEQRACFLNSGEVRTIQLPEQMEDLLQILP